MNGIKMIYYDKIDVFEGIDINKTNASKECDICHFWYFSNKWFKFQPYVCNRCHDLLMMYMNLSYIAILKTKSAGYCCIKSEKPNCCSKSEDITLQNIDLTKKCGTL